MASTRNFSSGYREIGYRFELLNRIFEPVGDITDQVIDATIDHNAFASIHRTAKFTIKENTGSVPATVSQDIQREYWEASVKNNSWDSPDMWIYNDAISYPSYKIYSGDDNNFRGVPQDSTIVGGAWTNKKPTGWTVVTNLTVAQTEMQILPTGGIISDAFNTNVQRIKKLAATSGFVGLETNSSMTIASKRVYFTGFFRSNDIMVAKPDINVVYRGGSSGVNYDLVQVPPAQITVTNVGDGSTGEWKFFEGYYDKGPRGDRTACAFAVGCGESSAKEIYYDSFFYDADRSVPFRFTCDATSPVIDCSISDANNVANSLKKSLCSLSSTLQNTPTNTGLQSPVNKLEVRYSYNGGSSWSSWGTPSSVATEGADMRNMRVQFKYTATCYTQWNQPRLDSWRSKLGGRTNVANPNKDKIDYINHRVKPYLQINENGTWQEYPLGVFLLSSPKRQDNEGGVIREVDAYDQLTILSQAKLAFPITVKPERDDPNAFGDGGWAKTVKNILTGVQPLGGYPLETFTAGQTWLSDFINIPNDTYTNPQTSRGRNFKMGDSWLSVLNELLRAGNYTPLYCTSDGILTSIPYVSPDLKPNKFTYLDDEMSIIFTEASEEMDTFEIANAFVAYQPSDMNGVELVGRYFNYNEGSPSSFATQGRWITDYRDVDNMESQSEIDNYIYRLAYEASQVYGQINFNTALDPNHEHLDNIYLRYQDLQIDGRFTETAWSMHLTEDPYMEHRLRRIVTI